MRKTVSRYWVLRGKPDGFAAVKVTGYSADYDFGAFDPSLTIDSRYERVSVFGYWAYRLTWRIRQFVGRVREGVNSARRFHAHR